MQGTDLNQTSMFRPVSAGIMTVPRMNHVSRFPPTTLIKMHCAKRLIALLYLTGRWKIQPTNQPINYLANQPTNQPTFCRCYTQGREVFGMNFLVLMLLYWFTSFQLSDIFSPPPPPHPPPPKKKKKEDKASLLEQQLANVDQPGST